MPDSLTRIVLVARDIELRIISLIIRCREVADDVVILDTGSNDETVDLAHEVGSKVCHYNGDLSPQSIASYLLEQELADGNTLILRVSRGWKLSDLPLAVNRAREPWDIHYTYKDESSGIEDDADVVLSSTKIRHLVLSEDGCKALAALSPLGTQQDVPSQLQVRFVEAEAPINLPQRESLATASRFAQLFYWMLESKHPLLLFGIPGIVIFVLGYRLSGDLATMFTELNSTSIGVTLATIAMTLVGLFAMMVAIILYIMGKQVERIQHQYNWPKQN